MTAVRPARERDLARCRVIQAAALAEPWPDLLPTALAGEAPFLVLTDGGEVCGYAVALAAEGEPAYVPEFAIDPARQGEGLGTRLMRGLCRRLRADGHGEVRLTVHAAGGDGLLLARRLDGPAGAAAGDGAE